MSRSRFPHLDPLALALGLIWCAAGGLTSCRDRSTPLGQPKRESLPTVVVGKTPEGIQSPAPSESPASNPSLSCAISAYVIDTDPKGLNVREAPNADSEIIGQLPTDVETVVDIMASQGEWVQISLAESPGKIEFQGQGWVYASLLGTATQPQTDERVKLHAAASAASPVTDQLPADFATVSLLGCQGKWARVQREDSQGWLSPEEQCPNPFTTCP